MTPGDLLAPAQPWPWPCVQYQGQSHGQPHPGPLGAMEGMLGNGVWGLGVGRGRAQLPLLRPLPPGLSLLLWEVGVMLSLAQAGMTHGGLAQGHPPSPLHVLPLPQPSDSPPSLPPSQSRVIYLPDGDRRQWLELELLSGDQLAVAEQTARAN